MSSVNSSGKREKIIGIDLGTTNSAAALVEAGHPVTIPSAEGPTLAGKMFPSVVAFTKDGQLLIGDPAKRQALTNPEGTIFEIKRKMGTDYKVRVYGKEYSPQQISAFILQKIKKDAETFLGTEVKRVVITVPAHFNDNQRQATKDAGEIAGLEVVRIINEPTAASLAYGLDKQEMEQKILVFSFGGGTNDTTIMEFGGGVFQVLATSGDTKIGGTDLDNAVMEYLIEEFQRDNPQINLRDDKKAMARLREAAEKAKIELSNLTATDVDLPFLASDASGPKHLHVTITRMKLEQLVYPFVQKIRDPIIKVLTDAKLEPKDIAKVILIGGQTRMPLVKKFVEDLLGKPAERGIDPMECVAIGAAIQGAVLAGEVKNLLLLDVTPLSLGVETLGGIATKLMEKNTTIPTKRSQTFSTASDFQTSVTIHVLQGERPMAADNVSLGMFNLVGIPPAPRGVPQIEVTFDIDANGILNVTAKDIATGNQQKITISASTKLSESEKNRMVKEAEQFAEQDQIKKETAEVLNNADNLLYTAEKTMKDLGSKLTEDQKKKIQDDVTALREAMNIKDLPKIKNKSEELTKTLQDTSAAVYQQAAAQQQQQQQNQQQGPQSQPGKGEAGSNEEKVVDVESKVVDEEKK